jgi:uracil-DNA glycosylase
LASFRAVNRVHFPDQFNAPVPAFGSLDAAFLVVGLAPGLRGANFSGRPFTGDYAGELLYQTLIRCGFADGVYGARPDDGLTLKNCRITNAVRCVPPENKPTPEEGHACRPFLIHEIESMPNLSVILALGKISHDSVMRAFGLKLSAFPFIHGKKHQVSNKIAVFDSYHCSRYNTNTGRLTEDMFRAVVEDAVKESRV